MKIFYNVLHRMFQIPSPVKKESPRKKLVMAVGSSFHSSFQSIFQLDDAEKEVKIDFPPLVGHIDGLKDGILYEIKTVNSHSFRSLSAPYPAHIVQINTYMGILGIEKGKLVYIDRDEGRSKEFDYVFDPELYHKTLERARTIVELAAKYIPPEPQPLKFDCEECPYKKLCPLNKKDGWNYVAKSGKAHGIYALVVNNAIEKGTVKVPELLPAFSAYSPASPYFYEPPHRRTRLILSLAVAATFLLIFIWFFIIVKNGTARLIFALIFVVHNIMLWQLSRRRPIL